MQYWKLGILLSCMAVVGGISTASSPLDRSTSVMEAQSFVEDTLQMQERNSKQSVPYAIIYNVLEQRCDASTIKDTKKLVEALKSSRTSNVRSQNLKSEMEKRFNLLKSMTTTLKATDEKVFCKQKYLFYSLMEYTQSLYLGKNSTIKTPVIAVKKETPTAQLPVEQVLQSEDTHGSATTPHYLTLINNATTLSDKTDVLISQLTDDYIQKEVWKLIALGLLKSSDITTLDEKIELNYVKGCGTTRGSYHMTQKTDGSNKKFKMIKLNINLCNNQTYIANFDKYVRQIFIHELGHYFYYFKDSSTASFDNLCRSQGKTNCTASDFISTYAQKNKEEDYAESFAHWYLEKTSGGTMIVDQEHGSATTTSKIMSTKEQYFDYAYGK